MSLVREKIRGLMRISTVQYLSLCNVLKVSLVLVATFLNGCVLLNIPDPLNDKEDTSIYPDSPSGPESIYEPDSKSK
jgi:hypothetical protein